MSRILITFILCSMVLTFSLWTKDNVLGVIPTWHKEWNQNEPFPGEIGDAVYRSLDNGILGPAGHAGIVVGYDREKNQLKVAQASGQNQITSIVTWDVFLRGNNTKNPPQPFWGARTYKKGGKELDLLARNNIVYHATYGEYFAKPPKGKIPKGLMNKPYIMAHPWQPYFPGVKHVPQKGEVTHLRCDGFVELAYERAGFDPCHFPPVGPQNQANELWPAVYKNPEIKNITTNLRNCFIVVYDEHSGIDYVTLEIQKKEKNPSKPLKKEPNGMIYEWTHPIYLDMHKTKEFTDKSEKWETKYKFDHRKYYYQVRFRVYDKVHHEEISQLITMI